MTKARQQSLPLKTAEQLRLVASPAAMEIMQVLRIHGPASVRDLGPKIGRKSNSLHYHIRKLVNAGIVRETGTRLSGARTEKIYDVSAERFEGADLHKDNELRRLAAQSVKSLTRLASRDFERASERSEDIVAMGKHRNILAHRVSARLSKHQLAEVNSHIGRIEEIFAANVGSKSGGMYALTIVMTPLERA